ncbi:MAG: tRNA pseudouridine(38-40) synthase TruA [Parachlamydiaceae bacterium]|nr:tRNA pseudouridine(38-40) synthase TruA [Parachlamydiaceae bacterium]
MHNIKLIIAYDGTSYLGWQRVINGPSIEETLQKVLEKILQQPILLQAASRTDAGVHASGQVVNFLANLPLLNLYRLKGSLNRLLPKDIIIIDVEEMHDSFHPTMDCIAKEYRYFICYGPTQLPQNRLYSWHCPKSLILDEIRESISALIGSYDFSAFCNQKKLTTHKNFVRNLHKIELFDLNEKRLCISIQGNNFLYKMVRNIVGTLIYIGKGKIDRNSLSDILKSQDRKTAGVTAPAHGLFLHQISYSNKL